LTAANPARRRTQKEGFMLILGLILLLLGFLLGVPVLWTIGIVLLIIGAVLFLLGSTGRAVGGRRHWF
jgi:1,4-dihydroxy-2-naphthoate octaprenyltransferase